MSGKGCSGQAAVLGTSPLPGKAELKQETINSLSCQIVVFKQLKNLTLTQMYSEPVSKMCSTCY